MMVAGPNEQGGKNARWEACLAYTSRNLRSIPSSVEARTERNSSVQSEDGGIGFWKRGEDADAANECRRLCLVSFQTSAPSAALPGRSPPHQAAPEMVLLPQSPHTGITAPARRASQRVQRKNGRKDTVTTWGSKKRGRLAQSEQGSHHLPFCPAQLC